MEDFGRSDVIKIEKLNGSNYQTWKFNMKLILMERSLWGFIDGREEVPESTAEASAILKYQNRSDRAYSIIALNIERSLQIHIASTSIPKEAWDILSNQFAFVSITHMVRLSRKFYAATMDENGDLMKHITHMTNLDEQLRELKEDISSQKIQYGNSW